MPRCTHIGAGPVLVACRRIPRMRSGSGACVNAPAVLDARAGAAEWGCGSGLLGVGDRVGERGRGAGVRVGGGAGATRADMCSLPGGEADASVNTRSFPLEIRLAPGETALAGLGVIRGLGRGLIGRREAGRYCSTGTTSCITRLPSSGGVFGVTPIVEAKNAAAV